MSQGTFLPAVANRILDWLVPACCLACRAPVSALRVDCGLCSACRSRLAPAEPGEVCRICAEPLPPGPGDRSGAACAACQVRRPAYDRLLAAWWYQPPLDAVIQDLKFRRLDYLGGHLARTMAERLANLEDVFTVRQAGALAGHRVFLVDDVATTGATLEAAARALKEQGATEVIGLVAARTPLLRKGPR